MQEQKQAMPGMQAAQSLQSENHWEQATRDHQRAMYSGQMQQHQPMQQEVMQTIHGMQAISAMPETQHLVQQQAMLQHRQIMLQQQQPQSQQQPQIHQVHVAGVTTSTPFTVPCTWELLRNLGTGSYATVAAFKDESGTFAVKRVDKPLSCAILALRTLREIRLLAHFDHPNVLSIRELFIPRSNCDDIYVRLDIMDGDLNLLIHRQKQDLTDYQMQCMLYQVMRGLLCLRVARVVHRDLKPGNVLFRHSGEVKLADLGLARSIDADGADTPLLTEYVVTRFYRAPEVVLTATRYTYAVDIWSVGCILGEMLTRKQLFRGKDSLDQIAKILAVIGAPSAEDLSWIPDGAALQFVEKNAQRCSGQALRSVLPAGANPAAVDLLARMLCFNPSRRISVHHCLTHPYLQSFQAADDPDVKAALELLPVDWSFDVELCFDVSGQPKDYDACRFAAAFLEAQQLVSRRAAPVCSTEAEKRSQPERRAAPRSERKRAEPRSERKSSAAANVDVATTVHEATSLAGGSSRARQGVVTVLPAEESLGTCAYLEAASSR